MSKKFVFIVMGLFLGLISCARAQEHLVITTYYPSPNGSYHTLSTDSETVGSTYRANLPALPDGTLIVSGLVGIGTTDTMGAKLMVNGGGLPVRTVLLSGDTTASAYIVAGRTGEEIQIGVAGRPGQFFGNTLAGDTVLKNNGAGNIHLGVGGDTSTMVLSNNYYVGIGTASPKTKLDVSGTQQAAVTSIQQSVSNNAVAINYARGANGGYDPGVIWYATDNNFGQPKAGIWIQDTNLGSYLDFGTSNNYATGITNTAMTIDYNGNVGIGTANSSAGFEYDSNTPSNTVDKMILQGGYLAGAGGQGYGFYQAYNLKHSISGVVWTAARIKAVESPGYGGQLIFETNPAPGSPTGTTNEAMRIIANGNVGIGTWTPQANLEIYKNMLGGGYWNTPTAGIILDRYPPPASPYPAGDVRGSAIFHAYRNNAGDYEYLAFAVAGPNSGTPLAMGQVKMVIDQGGYVGIGTNTPRYLIDTKGGAYCDGMNWSFLASDRAYKKDINYDFKYGLKEVAQLTPVYFVYKQDKENKKQVGFIAQDVLKVIPELVSGSEGSYRLSYEQLTAVLVKAIQEQQAQIEELKDQVRKLRKTP